MFIYFWRRETKREWGRGREKGSQRIPSRMQALSCRHRAWCRAQTHKLWDHDLSQSQMLNQLSHPDAPEKNVLMFIFERENEWGRGRKRGRHRIGSRLQALSWQHRAWRGAQTHKLWDHDLSQSWVLNRLSHPGAPSPPFFLIVYFW